MTAPDMVLVISAIGGLLVSLGTLALQIITAARVGHVKTSVAEVQKHTNGMLETMLESAKKEGKQEEKDKQS